VTRRPQPSIIELAIRNLVAGGMSPTKASLKGAQAAVLVWALGHAAHELGRWPTQAEYAAFWGISERTAQREWVLFGQAFPGEQSPERLARHIVAELGKRIGDKKSAGDSLAVSAPVSPA